MTDTITLQLIDLQLKKYKKLDLQKKLDIILNIVKKCKHIKDELYDDIEKVADLTGVSSETLAQIKQLDDTSRKFQDWFAEKAPVPNHQLYHKVKTYLRHCYIQKRTIPSRKYIKDLFKAYNFERYFTSVQLPGLKKSIVVEKPELMLKRHRYLYTKLMYAEEGRNIVYIESTNIFNRKGALKLNKANSDTQTSGFILAVLPKTGFVNSIFTCGSDTKHLTHWLAEHVIPAIPPASVLIVQDNLLGQKITIPNSHNSKEDMSYWLHAHNIAHDPSMHKAELFLLIEKYRKTTCELRDMEVLIKVNGHTVLCREEDMFDFTFYEPFWKDLSRKMKKSKKNDIASSKYNIPYKVMEFSKSMGMEYWRLLEVATVKAEIDIYRSDMEMEETIDRLLTLTSNEGLDNEIDENLDTHCKATDQEYIFSKFSYV